MTGAQNGALYSWIFEAHRKSSIIHAMATSILIHGLTSQVCIAQE